VFHFFFRLVCRSDALDKNQDLEFERNKERFVFLKVNLSLLVFSGYFICLHFLFPLLFSSSIYFNYSSTLHCSGELKLFKTCL